MGEQHPAVDVAGGVQPAAGNRGHPHAVVDVDPVAGSEADGLQSHVFGAWGAAGGDEQLVGLQLLPVLQGHRHRPVLAGTVHTGHPGCGPHIHPAVAQQVGDQLPDEPLDLRQ